MFFVIPAVLVMLALVALLYLGPIAAGVPAFITGLITQAFESQTGYLFVEFGLLSLAAASVYVAINLLEGIPEDQDPQLAARFGDARSMLIGVVFGILFAMAALAFAYLCAKLSVVLPLALTDHWMSPLLFVLSSLVALVAFLAIGYSLCAAWTRRACLRLASFRLKS